MTKAQAGTGQMSEMVDPYVSLVSFRDEYEAGNLTTQAGAIHRDIRFHYDVPAPGEFRLTYALLRGPKVVALVIFARAPALDGLPCFAVGYAVDDSMRSQGLGKEVLIKGLQELWRGMGPHMGRFYIEAVVGAHNPSSQRVAAAVLSDSPVPGTDGVSGESCYAYRRLIETDPA
jgi:hypothetical protein